MRIFKNKIIFFVFFSEACAAWGYHRSPTDLALLPAGQWVRRTNLPSAADFQFTDDADFFDLFGQIHADFSFFILF